MYEVHMKNQKWTPGKWEVFGWRRIRSVQGGTATPLAEMIPPFRPGVGPMRVHEEEQANIKIMSAAPDLAKALAKLIDASEDARQTAKVHAARARAIALLKSCGWKW